MPARSPKKSPTATPKLSPIRILSVERVMMLPCAPELVLYLFKFGRTICMTNPGFPDFAFDKFKVFHLCLVFRPESRGKRQKARSQKNPHVAMARDSTPGQ